MKKCFQRVITMFAVFLVLLSANSVLAAGTRDLGAMTAQEALEYMQQTENLLIVDVAFERWYAQEHFTGAVSIPIENLSADEAKARYMALPPDRPVLLHCRRGVIVPGAYRTLKELRPDIPEIAYIAGVPPFAPYNQWAANR